MNKLPISYYFPKKTLDNDQLENVFTDWNAKKIYRKTGIRTRHIAQEETVSDMAVCAGKQLFEEYNISPSHVEFIILVTQTPDYILPTTACLVQDRLGIPKQTGALDINLGCSGYIYAISLAKGLVTSNIVKNVLLLTSETYSKHINPLDKSSRTIFGDAATASFLTSENVSCFKEFVFGTDGSGYDKLIIPAGGGKIPITDDTKVELTDNNGYVRSQENLYMDGIAIFNFSMEVVPTLVSDTLLKNNLSMEDVDLYIFHQANRFMLESLRDILNIPEEKFFISVENIGNTVSSTIPIALKMAQENKQLKTGMKVMLVGFGVGLSWGATVFEY